jgi:hypothetical protein
VVNLGGGSFKQCLDLLSVTIGTGVTSIQDQTFEGCVNLSNLSIGSNVQNISSLAFGYCTSLTSVTIPISVTSIGSYAFAGCTTLTTIYCYAESSVFDQENILLDTDIYLIFARILDPTWSNGSFYIGGRTVTVTKNL